MSAAWDTGVRSQDRGRPHGLRCFVSAALDRYAYVCLSVTATLTQLPRVSHCLINQRALGGPRTP